MNAKKILFVCFANICRSPTAEAVFHQLACELGLSHRLLSDSAGCSDVRLGEPADTTARKVATKKGYTLTDHTARMVHKKDGEQFDYIVAMDNYNLLELREILPASEHHKISLLLDHVPGREGHDVPDPYKRSKAAYAQALSLIEEGTEGLLNHIRLTHKI